MRESGTPHAPRRYIEASRRLISPRDPRIYMAAYNGAPGLRSRTRRGRRRSPDDSGINRGNVYTHLPTRNPSPDEATTVNVYTVRVSYRDGREFPARVSSAVDRTRVYTARLVSRRFSVSSRCALCPLAAIPRLLAPALPLGSHRSLYFLVPVTFEILEPHLCTINPSPRSPSHPLILPLPPPLYSANVHALYGIRLVYRRSERTLEPVRVQR